MAHPVINISLDSEGSGGSFDDLLLREFLDKYNRRDCDSFEEFAIKPEISFTPEGSSNTLTDPQLGAEAESRLNSGAEPSSSVPNAKGQMNQEDTDLYDQGRVCPYAHFFESDGESYENFRREYHIPDDVMLNRVPSDKIKDKDRHRPTHITVPLMAICEAGLRFPLHLFLREILSRYSLAPHQLAINSYWIIILVIVLKESHNLVFNVPDLFHTYNMSWHWTSGHRFLTTRRGEEPLINKLPDMDKWADLYVEVHGNYEFGSSLNRNHYVPKVKDTKGLFLFRYLFIESLPTNVVCTLVMFFSFLSQSSVP